MEDEMKKIYIGSWWDLVRNIPSWIQTRMVLVDYAKHRSGLMISVSEVREPLDFPEFTTMPDRQFTKQNVIDFVTVVGGTSYNFVVNCNGTWYEIVTPFVFYNGERKYISADLLEALNAWFLLCGCNLSVSEQTAFIGKLFPKPESGRIDPEDARSFLGI